MSAPHPFHEQWMATGPRRLAKIRQRFARPVLDDVEGEVRASVVGRLGLRRGARVAVAVGSRGIANLDRIVRATVAGIREVGGDPFVVPAMGSHGGATADGQRELLAGYGVTEAGIGCPVLSSMDVVEVPGMGGPECRVYMDRLAFESDGVVLVNRIKPHTDFHGRYESGLVKMSVIGLGKVAGAEEMHRHGVRGLTELLPAAATRLLGSGRILLGVGIVENAYDETMLVEAIEAARILEREPELLEVARANMPRLPVDRLDVLVVDRMGKDISGVGVDTNIIGRMRIRGQPEPARPDIAMLVVSDLTEASHGNAAGMGLVDIATRRFFHRVDLAVTNTNVATSGFMERARLPMIAETDAQAVEWALRGCGPILPGRERIVRIRDTLHLDELYVSRAVFEELASAGNIEAIAPPADLLDPRGGLVPF